MKIAVVGTGYVGLVSGTCFAETGVDVTCVDIDEQKIENLKQGIIPIFEPGLESLVLKNAQKKRLNFSIALKDVIAGCEAVFIAVGTPPDEDGSADLQYVVSVASEIGKYMSDYLVVVTKSTVPIGTAVKVKEAVQKSLKERAANIPFDVASNPEFLKEGDAINDFLKPDRIVIGTESDRAEDVMKRLYKPFLMNNHPILFMDIPSAEMTKYAANAMLATKISFMNDIANLCEIVGADINSIRIGIGSDSRIGNKFLYAGAGYGGSCFPKDVKALIKTSEEKGHQLSILQSVEDVNERQKEVMFKKITDHYGNDLKGKKFAVWGLAFKPQTDDMREAPSIVLIHSLLKAGATVVATDPVAIEECKRRIGDIIEYNDNQYEMLDEADALIIITEWSEYRNPSWKIMEKMLKEKVIFDGRNIYEPEEMKQWNWSYYSIGRNPIK